MGPLLSILIFWASNAFIILEIKVEPLRTENAFPFEHRRRFQKEVLITREVIRKYFDGGSVFFQSCARKEGCFYPIIKLFPMQRSFTVLLAKGVCFLEGAILSEDTFVAFLIHNCIIG